MTLGKDVYVLYQLVRFNTGEEPETKIACSTYLLGDVAH